MTHYQLIQLLLSTVARSNAEELLSRCTHFGFEQVPYTRSSHDSNMPHFDRGCHFKTQVGNSSVLFEVLIRDEKILQAGYTASMPKSFFNLKSRYLQRTIKQHLMDFYGDYSQMEISSSQIFNYGNESTVAYFSITPTYAMDTLIVRVGDQVFWS